MWFCVAAGLQPHLTFIDADHSSQQDNIEHGAGEALSSAGQNHSHVINSHPLDITAINRALSSPSSLSTDPRQLLVPIVYVNADGLPMSHEVVQPVPSLLDLTSTPARNNGLYGCVLCYI